MTTASQGLAKALGRSASGEVIAIAEMSAADLLAALSDDKKAELSAALAPASAAGKPAGENDAEDAAEGSEGSESDAEDAAEGDEGQDGKKPGMGKADAAPLKSNASVHERVKAVAAAVAGDGALKGKAGLALQMLGDDDFAALNADAVIKLLGKTGASEANEDAARAEMKAALANSTNSNVSADSGKTDAKATASASIWDQAISLNNPGRS